MRKYGEELKTSQLQVPLSEFLLTYNQTMPESFPRASVPLLKKFREEHAALFKHSELWSLDQHRKKLMDWLPLNHDVA